MRAIDADAFKDYIRGACEEMKHLYKDNGAWAKEITESFCKDIDEQPTIQPEPIDLPDNNVGDMISRSSLLAKYDKEHEGPPGRARKLIEEEPPVHTEIIYCKDCGHRDDHGCCKYWKALAIGDIPIATDDNDFCSHAERRQNEH